MIWTLSGKLPDFATKALSWVETTAGASAAFSATVGGAADSAKGDGNSLAALLALSFETGSGSGSAALATAASSAGEAVSALETACGGLGFAFAGNRT